ncbi:thiopurine S-methyltransferase [Chelatococcus sambhunathii]|nr:thiopurine S-methyltransferase [Chelatococcus sambhunathii]
MTAMDETFWRDRWRENRLGWHQPQSHPMLVRRLAALGLEAGSRVFLPLCGKTLDVGWLLGQGFRVAGAELVETAIEQLFAELGVEPEIAQAGASLRYGADGIDIFVGDLFDLTAETLGPVDAVYDRAALVALPAETRRAYAVHLAEITNRAPQLLITFDYDQDRMEGPPFSVTEEEVRALYAGDFEIDLLESAEVEGGLKGLCPATEQAWALRPRRTG